MKTSEQSEWLTKQEAAEYLNVSFKWIRNAMADGRLPYHKFNRLVRIRRSDLDAYAEQSRVGAQR